MIKDYWSQEIIDGNVDIAILQYGCICCKMIF